MTTVVQLLCDTFGEHCTCGCISINYAAAANTTPEQNTRKRLDGLAWNPTLSRVVGGPFVCAFPLRRAVLYFVILRRIAFVDDWYCIYGASCSAFAPLLSLMVVSPPL